VAVKELTCTGNHVAEVGCHPSSSQPSPFPASNRAGIHFCWANGESFWKIQYTSFCLEPGSISPNGDSFNHWVTTPPSKDRSYLLAGFLLSLGLKIFFLLWFSNGSIDVPTHLRRSVCMIGSCNRSVTRLLLNRLLSSSWSTCLSVLHGASTSTCGWKTIHEAIYSPVSISKRLRIWVNIRGYSCYTEHRQPSARNACSSRSFTECVIKRLSVCTGGWASFV